MTQTETLELLVATLQQANSSQSESIERLTRPVSYTHLLKAEFRHNPDTFIWGQDVANREKGGVFNVTKGMQQDVYKRQPHDKSLQP